MPIDFSSLSDENGNVNPVIINEWLKNGDKKGMNDDFFLLIIIKCSLSVFLCSDYKMLKGI